MCINHEDYERREYRIRQTTTADAGRVRVSTAEREAVVEQLRVHTADGRLTLDEFGERVEVALGAVTRDDLKATLEALPPLTGSALRPPGQRVWPHTGWTRLMRVALVIVLIIAAVVFGRPWLVFPLAWFFLTRTYGPWRRRQWATRPR